MSNSAISGNVQGLASATSPGLVGTGPQVFAGKKTLDGGALIKGDTSGVAIASGYVGEIDTQTQATSVSLVSSGSATTTAKTLQPGNYLLVGTISINVSSNTTAINCSFAGQTKCVFSLGGITATTGNARLSFMVPVRISTATAYSFSVFSAGTVSGTISGTDQDTTWSAIRIA